MDWESTEPSEGLAPALGGAGPGDAGELALEQSQDILPSYGGRRHVARKISHRKNPSDTFAFAAGQLFQNTAEDFYNLLDPPLDLSSASQGLQHAVSADKLPVSSHQALGRSLQQDPTAALASGARSLSGTDLQDCTTSTQQTKPSAAKPADHMQPSKSDAAAVLHAADAEDQQPDEDTAIQDNELDIDEEEDDEEQQQQHSRGSRKHAAGQTRANALDPSTLDPRRAKRILANRQSAQRSRMKRLQYIHDLENKSAATSATVKELQTEVQRLQEWQAALAESVEARKTQVDTLSKQLHQEQSLQAAIVSHINALKSQATWVQQQQQLRQQQQQQQDALLQERQQQWLHLAAQQQQQQQMYIKQDPLQQSMHMGAATHHQDKHTYPQQQHGIGAESHLQQQRLYNEQQAHHMSGYHYSGTHPPITQMHSMGLGSSDAVAPSAAADRSSMGTHAYAYHNHHNQSPHDQQRQQQVVLPGRVVHQQPQQQPVTHTGPGNIRDSSQAVVTGVPGGSVTGRELGASGAVAAEASAHHPQAPQQHSIPPAAAAPKGLTTTKPMQHQQQQQLKQDSSFSAAAVPATDVNPSPFSTSAAALGLQRTPSPKKAQDLFASSTGNMNSAPSLGAGMPDLGDIDVLLQDQTFLTGGLSGTLSGALGSAGAALRLTPSMDLAGGLSEGFGPGWQGSQHDVGMGTTALAASAAPGVGGCGGPAGTAEPGVDVRKSLSM